MYVVQDIDVKLKLSASAVLDCSLYHSLGVRG